MTCLGPDNFFLRCYRSPGTGHLAVRSPRTISKVDEEHRSWDGLDSELIPVGHPFADFPGLRPAGRYRFWSEVGSAKPGRSSSRRHLASSQERLTVRIAGRNRLLPEARGKRGFCSRVAPSPDPTVRLPNVDRHGPKVLGVCWRIRRDEFMVTRSGRIRTAQRRAGRTWRGLQVIMASVYLFWVDFHRRPPEFSFSDRIASTPSMEYEPRPAPSAVSDRDRWSGITCDHRTIRYGPNRGRRSR
jgi:hypothetical protein